jgi:hypothetical protein
MLTLRQIFDNKLTLKSDKWEPYFDVYETYFAKFRNTNPTFVEVGVQSGGSMEMWREYFGAGARIFGIDIAPEVTEVEGTTIIVGDQSDPAFWDQQLPAIGQIDCFVDDGGHTAKQMMVTFEKVWPMIKPGGAYVCEDTHCSYWAGWEGGYKREGTFIEHAKKLADLLTHEHFQGGIPEELNSLPRDLLTVSFYNSQVAFIKGKPEFKRLIVNPK